MNPNENDDVVNLTVKDLNENFIVIQLPKSANVSDAMRMIETCFRVPMYSIIKTERKSFYTKQDIYERLRDREMAEALRQNKFYVDSRYRLVWLQEMKPLDVEASLSAYTFESDPTFLWIYVEFTLSPIKRVSPQNRIITHNDVLQVTKDLPKMNDMKLYNALNWPLQVR